ncbi:MAG: radical SAM protein [Candidatus Helarchaeota archaeon]
MSNKEIRSSRHFPAVNEIMKCDEKRFKKYQNQALQLKLKNFDENLWFYAPSLLNYAIEQFENFNHNKFIPISITGTKCQLQCDHCKSKILESMYPAESPEELYSLVESLVKNKGCEGILVSGGSTRDGAVPLLQFLEVFRKIKERFDITIIVHTGLVTEELAKSFSDISIDAVMLDIIGDNETIHRIYHLKKNIDHFEASLKYLNSFKIPFVPHVILGLHYGKIKGELSALKLIQPFKPSALVLLVLMPLEGTPMEHVQPISPSQFARFATIARFMFPTVPIMLGCARPKGDHKIKTDIMAIRSGLNGIAYPCQEAVDYALKKGYTIKFSELCCALIYQDLKR